LNFLKNNRLTAVVILLTLKTNTMKTTAKIIALAEMDAKMLQKMRLINNI